MVLLVVVVVEVTLVVLLVVVAVEVTLVVLVVVVVVEVTLVVLLVVVVVGFSQAQMLPAPCEALNADDWVMAAVLEKVR
jgi:hypothetical protein